MAVTARRTLLGAAALFVVAAVLGAPVAGHLSAGGFVDPSSPSSRADAMLARDFPGSAPALTVVVSCAAGVSASPCRAVGESIVGALRSDGRIGTVKSHWTTAAAGAALVARDRRSALVTATPTAAISAAGAARTALVLHWQRALEGAARPTGVSVRVFGTDLATREVTSTLKHDFEIAELVTLPVAAVLLFLVFGSAVAAAVPLVTGVLAIVSTLAILRLLAGVVQISVFALNLTTGLGLALAIDYSLLLVSRYREERARGCSGPQALTNTRRAAGRTVVLSAGIVTVSMASLAVFPLPFLRSFAYAGATVVLFDAACALVVTPAMLTLLGDRVGRLRGPSRRQTLWFRAASFAMRNAVPVLVLGVAALLTLAVPFMGVRYGPPDDRLLPASNPVRQEGDLLRREFPGVQPAAFTVVLPDGARVPDAALGAYAARLSRLAGVRSVSAVTGRYADGERVAAGAPAMASRGSTYLTVQSGTDPLGPAADRILAAARAVPAPATRLWTGPAARNADELGVLADRLPLALTIIAASTALAVFMLTGSIVLPVKAVVMTALSLTATFGALVWVFQDGHLLGLLSSTPSSGFLVATVPILMFCMAFGISMDYEIFLLARIFEERRRLTGRGCDSRHRGVREGLAAAGRIVSAAALLMATVFAGMMTARLQVVQMFGLGLLLFVVLDATLIRGLLLPAFMRVAGPVNWWAPGPLRRWHERHGWGHG